MPGKQKYHKWLLILLLTAMFAPAAFAQAGIWTENLPESLDVRAGHAMAAYDPDGEGERLWIMGGSTGGGYTTGARQNDIWSSTDGITWKLETLEADWGKRTGHAAAVFDPGDGLGKRLWVIGGSGNGGNLNDVWYSFDGVEWTRDVQQAFGPGLGRSGHATAVFDPDGNGERLWVLGGKGIGGNGGYLNDVWSGAWSADLNRLVWERHDPPPGSEKWDSRTHHAVVAFNGRLWVMGGLFSTGSGQSVVTTRFRDVWWSNDGAEWHPASIPGWSGRYGHTATVFAPDGINERIWVMGGNPTDGNPADWCSNEVWSSDNGESWTKEVEAAWRGRFLHTAAVFDPDGEGGRLWVAAGIYDDQQLGDIRNDVWSSANGIDWRRMDLPRLTDHAGVAFDPGDGDGERLWVTGGETSWGDGQLGKVRDVWSSKDGKTWVQETQSPPWSARSAHAMAVFDPDGAGKRMWILGGLGASGRLNDVWSSTDGLNWEEHTPPGPIWSTRFSHTALVFAPPGQSERLWVIGGNSVGFRKDVWSATWSPIHNTLEWEEVTAAAPWDARSGHGAAAHNGRMWIMAGATQGQVLNDVWSSADGKTWQPASTNTPWAKRQGLGTASFAGLLWAFGGFTLNGAYMSDLWYSTNGAQWQPVPAAPWVGRSGFATTVMQDRLWMMGGWGILPVYGGGGYLRQMNDVWSFATLPFIASEPPETATPEMPYTYEIVAAGSPAPTIEASGLPAWLTLQGNVLSGTPAPDDLGETGLITITATIDTYTAQQQFTISVQPLAASIVSTPSLTAPVGEFYNYVVVTEAWPAPELSTGSLPSWLDFDPVEGVLSGTPPAGAGGQNFPVQIMADNGLGAPATQNFVIHVPSIFGDGPGGGGAGGCALRPGSGQAGAGAGLGGMVLLLALSWLWRFRGRGKENATMRGNRALALALAVGLLAPCAFAQTAVWTKHVLTDLPPERTQQGVVVYDPGDGQGERMWVLGGSGLGDSATVRLNDVWSSFDGVSWTLVTPQADWVARQGHAAAVFDPGDGDGPRMWVLGGVRGPLQAGDPNTTYLNDVWFSFDGATWQEYVPPIGTEVWVPRDSHTTAVFDPDGAGERLWVLGGGSTGSTRFNDVWSFDGVKWIEHQIPDGQDRWLPRIHHTTAVFDPDGFGERLWVLGGAASLNPGSQNQNEIWSSTDGTHWQKHEIPDGEVRWSVRQGHGTEVFDPGDGPRLWVFGGIGGGTNDVWSSTDGASWTQVTPAAQWPNRHYFGTAVFDPDGAGERLWLLGGTYMGTLEITVGEHNAVWSSSDGADWDLEAKVQTWVRRTDHASLVFDPDGAGERLWSLGGFAPEYIWEEYSNNVRSSYDGVEWVVENENAPWSRRYDHAAVVFDPGDGGGERMWILGGKDDGFYGKDVWWSSDGVEWHEAPDVPWSGRAGHSAVVFNGRLWIMGGVGPSGTLNDVWSATWSPIQNTLEWIPHFPPTQDHIWVPRFGHSTVVYDNKLWVVGGLSGVFQNDVWWSEDGNIWYPATHDAPWLPRRAHTTTVFDGRMWLIGGVASDPDYMQNDVWWSLNGANWFKLPGEAPWPARSGHTAVVHNERLYVLGGWYPTTNPLVPPTQPGVERRDIWSFATAPELALAPPQVAYLGQAYAYTIAVSGSPAPVIEVVGLPDWLILHGGMLQGTPTLADLGVTGPIVITATNDAGAIQHEFTINVQTLAPAFLSSPPLTAPVNELYSYIVEVESWPLPTLSTGALPAWLAFNEVSGELFGSPPAGASGRSFPVEIFADNGIDEPAAQSFTIQVPSIFGDGPGGGGAGGCAYRPGHGLALLLACLALLGLGRPTRRALTPNRRIFP